MYAFTAIFLGLMLVPQLLSAQSPDGGEFQLIKRSGEISLYERWIDIPGEEEKQAREVKSVFYYNSSIYAGLTLLKDQAMAMKWQDHVSEFKLYPQGDTALWYEYSYHDVPWPVSDQDHFMEYRISSCGPQKLLISFKSKVNEKLAPQRKGVTRMMLTGSWLLEQIDPGRVKVTYRIFSMPLDIPRMLTDPIVRTNMVSTIEDFVVLVEQP
ncbi:MAG TPA: hypothetical protein VK658_26520 [Chryseolinea sp.]|nr:hypothetical protein [Chryseolinea sp.]